MKMIDTRTFQSAPNGKKQASPSFHWNHFTKSSLYLLPEGNVCGIPQLRNRMYTATHADKTILPNRLLLQNTDKKKKQIHSNATTKSIVPSY